MLDVFHTLAEVSVAITGFSSLIIIFRGSSSEWSNQDYVSFAYALSWSIGCIFLSLLPIVLTEFGWEISVVTRFGLFSAFAYMCIVGSILMQVRNKIAHDHSRSDGDSSSLWRSATGGGLIGIGMSLSFLVIITGALMAGLGYFPGPSHAWYAATIVLLMAHATAELGFFVVATTRRAAR